MGWVLYRLGELDAAVEYLQQAYDKAPQAEIAAHLGEVYWELGQEQRARDIWSEAISEDAKNPVLLATMVRYGVSIEKADKLKLVES
jgi:tetratricopeptide (TPR) repeat protein